MARERSPNRDKAFELWQESSGEMPLKEIAQKLGVSDSQVRKWKNQDKWDENLKGNVTNGKSNVTNESKGNVTTRGGAPRGNKNALGNRGGHGAPKGNRYAVGNNGGAPIRNQNAIKTGEYETIWLDTLDDEERELYEQIDLDPLAQADEQIRFFSIRERRMMKRIKRFTEGLTDVQRRVLQQLKTTKEIVPITDPKTGNTTTMTVTHDRMMETEIEETVLPAIQRILELEDSLTRIQDKKLKAIQFKAQLLSNGGGPEKQITVRRWSRDKSSP
ncbi:phage terminase small subunit [Brevibacillus porteri]|uniref:Terminase n=1 Tax=Brevibacillus porteri TaxID=2126350 RepID=A0ABX5FGZ8_9BACL|nr:phage terminase small subunit [Brevibacillus porteri]MED1800314.1 phage terminase small subunit [Brevibacillus porteri]MED2130822.1 phage terminase small subunit [Brevibacillus porteri]MED2744918.1 phage terminase small subunit [Brevibacillus porteri]MED2813368.1 phage terminase small subunit [Brevibacillus porteri]MED2894964.1 phage terminase small subunit [Brevibacillus porteri]